MFAPLLLILAAAALGGVMALELRQPLPDSDAMVPATATGLPAPAAPPAPVAQADEAGARMTEILARPLFSSSRRPAAQAAKGPGGVPVLPRMTGVIATPTGRVAIFAGDAGKPIVVTEGGRIGAYDVRSIAAGQVTLAGPDGSHVLAPAFDPKPPARRSGPVAPPGLPGLPGLEGLNGLPGLTLQSPGAPNPGLPAR